jgi:hypothetical protein
LKFWKKKKRKEQNKGSSWEKRSGCIVQLDWGWLGLGWDNKFQNLTVGGAGRSLLSCHHHQSSTTIVHTCTYGAWTRTYKGLQ